MLTHYTCLYTHLDFTDHCFCIHVVGIWKSEYYFPFFLQEYSEESNSEPDVDLENQYYNSKALKDDDPKAALDNFQKVKHILKPFCCMSFIYIVFFFS